MGVGQIQGGPPRLVCLFSCRPSFTMKDVVWAKFYKTFYVRNLQLFGYKAVKPYSQAIY